MDNKQHSEPHEKKIEKIVRQVDENTYKDKNSGAGQFSHGDVKCSYGLLECKTLANKQKQQTIYKEDIEKINKEAFMANKDFSALVFNFGDIKGEEYFILNEQDFLNMYYAYIQQKEG